MTGGGVALKSPQSGLASGALLLATAIWGGTFVTVKDALAGADTYSFLALRFAVGALFAWLLARRLSPAASWGAALRPGLWLGGLLFGGYLLQTLGLERTTPSRSAFVTGLTVIFVPFVAWRLERRRPPLRSFLAPALALVGLQRLTGVTWGGELPTGDVLTLGCAVVYAVHIAMTSRVAQGVAPMVLTTIQLAVVAVLSTVCLPFVERRFDSTTTVWFGVIFTGVFASALAIGMQVWAQTHLSSVRAAVIYSLEPVFALVVAAAAGLGWPGSSELVGGAFILAAVLLESSGVTFTRARPVSKTPVSL